MDILWALGLGNATVSFDVLCWTCCVPGGDITLALDVFESENTKKSLGAK